MPFNGNPKLEHSEVFLIRRMIKMKVLFKHIGAIMGIHKSTVSAISTGQNWGWLREGE